MRRILRTIKNFQVSFEVPNICPICNYSITANDVCYHAEQICNDVYYPAEQIGSEDLEVYNICILFACPNCNNIFMVKYKYTFSNINNKALLISIYPKNFHKREFEDMIEKVSPKFTKIYNQALQAESSELNEICGMGYRKALEFLIKDYLIHIDHKNKELISTKPLAACIKDINNDHIRTLAEKSAWLGNDETHYIKKHPEYDLKNLKTFINALVYYISMELTFEEAKAIERK